MKGPSSVALVDQNFTQFASAEFNRDELKEFIQFKGLDEPRLPHQARHFDEALI